KKAGQLSLPEHRVLALVGSQMPSRSWSTWTWEQPLGSTGEAEVPGQASQGSRTPSLSASGVEPEQAPAWQVSTGVQLLPSLHAAPSVLLGFEHTPVPVSQVPATWHWSAAEHTTGLLPEQAPARQVSVCVHPLPSLQALPLALS